MAVKPLSKLPEEALTINRALLSVSDKTGLVPLAQALHKAGVELVSTGGTAEKIRSADIPVTDISELTGFPESLDGRVKTLHPYVHAGLLARTSHQPDVDELEKLDADPIELVVVNLYPFKETVSDPDCTPAIATENIDIGGPTMIRAAAKNFAHVSVLTSPDQYEEFIEQLSERESVSFAFRKELARQAFNHTADYDAHISEYFNSLFEEENPPQLNISLPKSQELRYGENPHQKAAVYGNQPEFIDCFHGKKLSYNNYLDLDGALNLIADFEDSDPTCGIFKHTVPCGVATDENLTRAWEKAFATDTKSPFGGIIVVNRELDLETAKKIDKIFTEIIIAPSFSTDAERLLKEKKNRRLVRLKKSIRGSEARQFRSIFGGALSQEPDFVTERMEDYKVVTDRDPTEEEIRDLLFSWKVVKHVKSNAIVYARDGQTIGIGTGQTSRVEASEIAIAKAKEEGLSTDNSVIASDAFFPFPDGVEAAAKAGSTAVIQPGGSIRDEEVIEMANKHNLAMVFTGKRHFRH
ncbi:bifunctional phosphoribosylaminoimidazolecarboxamide formyltransferase/IMP cyclohydrolase [Aliifodinibius sp. S!AR15-10]|uniref:bifunctional phosphoribosylaminoimidazolecarboxamide formyltransferase/IMP cyclohydrolase n=1 Tax=Aliifodinibius sp. S!AR15-10 TaxID=2950437 RepID=UPI002862319C|nr:bifunctional phosphoribosylaminoimidazolecarboxamide formyltransferase/IMP cyclohydrolase [Aliifodinibius sp. S!AR15-10]MDR8389769.1 bifunctional phosphoribosylaminoimidazolecarboxamide formyltransferase/IMP cyclohydrolase [Aliifodinibius sp. S!AR15-10]